MDSRNVIVKWANRCRLCLLDDGIKLPIFEGEGIQKQVARKIETCFPILIYVGDPMPKMICHKCLYKLDTVYDFRHKCLEANTILKKQLLTLTHIDEVKVYLDSLENRSASHLRKEVTQKPLPPDRASSVKRHVKTPEPVVPTRKDPSQEGKADAARFHSSSENVFQEVFLTDCSTDVFFPEQSLDEIAQGNENRNNSAKSPSREQPVPSPRNSPVDSVTAAPAITIKREPEDDTAEQVSPDEHREPVCPVTSQSSSPTPPSGNDTLPCADRKSSSLDPGKVKQEKIDTVECSMCKIRFQDKKQLQKHTCTALSRWSCEHCNKNFKSKETLYKHKKYFCPKKKNNCVCKGCSKVFASEIEMAEHQKVHLRVCISLQEENLYTCTVCGKKFAARSMLEMHKKCHSSGNSDMNKTGGFSDQLRLSPGKILGKKFRCQYCPRTYARKERLKLHMKTHIVDENTELAMKIKQSNQSDEDNNAMPQLKCNCKYCGHVFDDSTALWLHMLNQHSADQAYKCDKCNRSFSHLHAYSNHKRTHNAKMRCRVCGKLYATSKALQEHEYNKHSIQKATHRCRLCTESFVTRSALLIHGRVHHAKGKSDTPRLMEESEVRIGTLPCNLCSERFLSPMDLVAHMRIHIGIGKGGGPGISGMGDRGMGSGNMSNLDRRPVPQSSYKEDYSSLTCKICLRLFSSKGGLQRHIKIHATGKHTFYPCQVCGKKFVSESTYKTHAATHILSKSFHCSQCNKIFLKEEVFKIHVCENTGKQACLTCGLLLTEEQHLKHVCDESTLESSDALVRCSICSAVFSSLKARNNHMRIHGRQNALISTVPLGLKRMCVRMSNGLYKCNVCGKMTTTQQGAAAHSRWHTAPQPMKPYKCPFCKRKYTTETGLYSHISAEHPELPG